MEQNDAKKEVDFFHMDVEEDEQLEVFKVNTVREKCQRLKKRRCRSMA